VIVETTTDPSDVPAMFAVTTKQATECFEVVLGSRSLLERRVPEPASLRYARKGGVV
jgi:hypothetical protein